MTKEKKLKKPKKIPLEKLCLVPEDPDMASPDRDLCTRCKLHEGATTPFMPPQIPEGWTKRLLIVGERPGQDEDKKSGHPFSGRSGVLLRKWLTEEGFGAQDVAFTNATRCGGPDNTTPTMLQIRCCRPFLLWELAKLQPETVLGVGDSSRRAFTNEGPGSVTTSRGRLLDVPVRV